MIDASNVIAHSRENTSNIPVATARYTIEVVMNEEDFGKTSLEHQKAFSDEFQRSLDDGYFQDLRYNVMQFEVERVELDVAPANYPEHDEPCELHFMEWL